MRFASALHYTFPFDLLLFIYLSLLFFCTGLFLLQFLDNTPTSFLSLRASFHKSITNYSINSDSHTLYLFNNSFQYLGENYITTLVQEE